MPVYSFLKPAAKNENNENKRRADQNDSPFGDCTGHAKARSQPDAGCGGQPLDVFAFVVADDNAHAKKPNSGQDALNDAAHVGTGTAADGEDGECGTYPDKAKRANARWLAVKITVKAQRNASQRRRTEPQSNVEGVHGGTI
jgi:hypothetical protein